MAAYEKWLRRWLVHALAVMNPPVRVLLQNLSSRNLTSVRVQLHLSAEVSVCEDRSLAEISEHPSPRPPSPPVQPQLEVVPGFEAALGRASVIPHLNLPVLDGDPDVEVSTGSTSIRYQPVDLRPHDLVELPALRIIGRRRRVPDDIDVAWSATAKSHDGVASGDLTLAVADTYVQPVADQMMKLLNLSG